MSKLLVFEGLDGSGKSTQVNLLAESLKKDEISFRQISFPDYGSPSSALIKMYLGGDFGSSPGDVNAYAASLFYSVDRYASYKSSWGEYYNSGGLIICDRYTTSNAIHQCAKLPEDMRREYVDWLYSTEFDKMQIPSPNKVIYFDVEPEITQKLMSGRYGGDESKKDIHERDLDYQKKSREAALWCCENLGWERILSSENGAMRPKEAIAAEVYNIIRGIL